MQNVAEVHEKDTTAMPFGMLVMRTPGRDDILPSATQTMTTTYSTTSGPTSAPDDGATSTKDDD